MKILSISLGLMLLCSPAFSETDSKLKAELAADLKQQRERQEYLAEVERIKNKPIRDARRQQTFYNFAAAMAVAGQQIQYQNMIEQQRRPINVNCSSYGSGYSISTNCYGY